MKKKSKKSSGARWMELGWVWEDFGGGGFVGEGDNALSLLRQTR